MNNFTETITKAIEHLYAYLLKNLTSEDLLRMKDALDLAIEAHKDQKRRSGEPYIVHPIAVAEIVACELELGANPVIAALLHDVVEDSKFTLDDIRERFGNDVAYLVDIVTKRKTETPVKSTQVQNFRQLLESMHYDVRAVLIKLADRLHNMRTLESMKATKQMKIAGETDYFYAPLANRLGLYYIKSELENLSFRYRCPNEYAEIEEMLAKVKAADKDAIDNLSSEILQYLHNEGIDARIEVRHRLPYSVWRKMKTHQCEFAKVDDKHYIRIIFPDNNAMTEKEEKDMSLKIYSTLTDHFREKPGSFSNHIDAGKENGYKSLHVRILYEGLGWEEIHVASERMARKGRLGCAAEQTSENILLWLDKFRSVLKKVAEDSTKTNYLIDDVRMLIEYNDNILVFTPKGKGIFLPKGATALDFAFEIHTEVGEHARYARINGILSSVKTELSSGDCVEIGLDEQIQIRQDWEGHMKTYKASNAVKRYLDKQTKHNYVRCPHCNPLPGNEIIGFGPDPEHLTLHRRSCPEAIRLASQHGNEIHETELLGRADCLYPVKIVVRAVDRKHLISDLIECITMKLNLSMSAISSESVDNIATCTVDFGVHSAHDLRYIIKHIKKIEGVDEVISQQ